jgi:hypothetical protein
MNQRLKLSVWFFICWNLFTFLLISFNLWEINPLNWNLQNIQFFSVIGILIGLIMSLNLYFDTGSDENNFGM